MKGLVHMGLTKSEMERELKINEEDKKNIEAELETDKEIFARKVGRIGLDRNINAYYYKPIRYRKPLKVRVSEMWDKIKYVIFGL